MSIWSDHAVGALSDWEFKQEGIRLNNQDKWEREHEDALLDAFWNGYDHADDIEREENWDGSEAEEDDA